MSFLRVQSALINIAHVRKLEYVHFVHETQRKRTGHLKQKKVFLDDIEWRINFPLDKIK